MEENDGSPRRPVEGRVSKRVECVGAVTKLGQKKARAGGTGFLVCKYVYRSVLDDEFAYNHEVTFLESDEVDAVVEVTHVETELVETGFHRLDFALY